MPYPQSSFTIRRRIARASVAVVVVCGSAWVAIVVASCTRRGEGFVRYGYGYGWEGGFGGGGDGRSREYRDGLEGGLILDFGKLIRSLTIGVGVMVRVAVRRLRTAGTVIAVAVVVALLIR